MTTLSAIRSRLLCRNEGTRTLRIALRHEAVKGLAREKEGTRTLRVAGAGNVLAVMGNVYE